MAAADTVAALSAFAGRGGGTDAERRAAAHLMTELAAAGRPAHIETFWSRPNWPMAHAWHVTLAVAGSLVAISSPRVGGALVLAALVAILFDGLTGVSPGRRLTRERASQNVVSPAPARPEAGPAGPDPDPDPEPEVRLIVCANYDAGRMGLVHRPLLRRLGAALHRITGRRAPGWRAWLALDLVGLLVVALLRNGGHHGRGVAIAQLILTVALIITLALLVELAVSPFGPAANDNASGIAVAIALVRALTAAPPRHLTVELVLTGAADGSGAGLRHHLRSHPTPPHTPTIVLGLAASGSGHPVWWTGDGSLMPLRFSRPLAALTAEVAAATPDARPHRGRGSSPALPARRAGLAAITLGALDARGLAPRSHLPDDTPAAIDRATLDRVLALAVMLVDAIDAEAARPPTG